MFTGGAAPSLTNDAFIQYVTRVRHGDLQPLTEQNARDVLGQVSAAVNEEKARENNIRKDIFLEGLQQFSQNEGVRKMPQFNRYQETGFANLTDPSIFGKTTILPWDDETSGLRNYEGIVKSFDPAVFQASAQLLEAIQQMGPEAQQTLGYRGSIYTGVSSDFAVNRLYIANTRKREDSVYAFI